MWESILEGLDILLLFCIVGNGEIFSGKPPVRLLKVLDTDAILYGENIRNKWYFKVQVFQ